MKHNHPRDWPNRCPNRGAALRNKAPSLIGNLSGRPEVKEAALYPIMFSHCLAFCQFSLLLVPRLSARRQITAFATQAGDTCIGILILFTPFFFSRGAGSLASVTVRAQCTGRKLAHQRSVGIEVDRVRSPVMTGEQALSGLCERAAVEPQTGVNGEHRQEQSERPERLPSLFRERKRTVSRGIC